jgi:hypothetical protein
MDIKILSEVIKPQKDKHDIFLWYADIDLEIAWI